MKGLVFGRTFERASRELDDITENYKRYRYKVVKKIKTKY